MIYVVSGYRRSGTSAMMGVLKASGLPFISNAKTDELVKKQPVINGYKPTKNGYFEVGRNFYSNAQCMRDFVRDQDETAIKIFYDGLPILPAGKYTVIFMQRDSVEIIESLKRFDEYRQTFKQRPVDENDSYPFDLYAEYKPADVQHCLDIAKQRNDINVIEVNFKDLIDNPIQVFERLKKNGVPIDADNDVIDPDWYRCVA
jgi:hypothetical protein